MYNELNWSEAMWQEINQSVIKEVSKIRVAQKIFPTTVLTDNPVQVADEIIDIVNLTIKEGVTKPYVELYAEFTLTSTQVQQESAQHVCRTLAIMAAKAIALAEDRYIFQDKAVKVLFAPPITISNWVHADNPGLLAEAAAQTIDVQRLNPKSGVDAWGEHTFQAVTRGISKLVADTQAPPYALILPTGPYADTFVAPSPGSLVTTADRIQPLVEGGFYTSGVLPEYQGLLVALGGEPIKLYLGREATVEFIQKQGADYRFRVVERIQYIVRDPRALILLDFDK